MIHPGESGNATAKCCYLCMQGGELSQTQRVTEACANSPPRIRRIPHRESADFLTANSPTSPPRIPYREFADLSLSLANIDQWIRGESMANVRPIICVIGEYHSSRIRRIKFVWIRGEYSPRKFQMNSTVYTDAYYIYTFFSYGSFFFCKNIATKTCEKAFLQ